MDKENVMLTVSTKNQNYEIKLHGEVIAKACKAIVASSTLFHLVGTDKYFVRMKDLKEYLWGTLSAEQKEPPVKPKVWNKEIWMDLCAISHTGVYVHIREAKKLWPELKGSNLYAYLIRKGMEAVASWTGPTAQNAARWLADHSEVGVYDHEEELRRLAIIYPDAGVQ